METNNEATQQPPKLEPIEESIDRLTYTMEQGLAPYCGRSGIKDAGGTTVHGVTDAIVGLTRVVDRLDLTLNRYMADRR